MWATHQDRTDWEVEQWRRARPVSPLESGAVVTLPRKTAPLSLPPSATDGWNGFLTSSDPTPSHPRPARERRSGLGFVAILMRALRRLRRGFGASVMVPLDVKPEPQQPVIEVRREQAPQPEAPPRMALVPDVAEPSVADAIPAEPKPPAPARKAPPKPRKRPAPPTNKDMLKKTLSVLTKVEQRLEQLEQEVAGIDDAVRRAVPTAGANDEQTAVGE